MGRGIDESAVVVLAVDFDQSGAERAQHLHADRLIVDEGAGAAVGELHAPHDQFVLAVEIVLGEHAPRRMFLGEIEGGDHLALFGAFAHQRRRRRGRRARARRRRAGSICRRRSRRSARQGRSRNRCPAVRSGRCRGWKDGPAWLPRRLEQYGTKHRARDSQSRPISPAPIITDSWWSRQISFDPRAVGRPAAVRAGAAAKPAAAASRSD